MFPLSLTGEPIWFVEYATQLATNKCTHVTLLEIWTPTSCGKPATAAHLDPNATYHELLLNSRYQLSRVHYCMTALLDTIVAHFRALKYDKNIVAHIFPKGFDGNCEIVNWPTIKDQEQFVVNPKSKLDGSQDDT